MKIRKPEDRATFLIMAASSCRWWLHVAGGTWWTDGLR